MGADVVVGGFWGDEAKGLVSAWQSYRTHAMGVFRGCGGSNPEHGLFFNVHYIKVNQLPLGFILQDSEIGLGPGTAVDPDKFLKEVHRFRLSPDKVKVDYRCPIITPANIQEEIDSASMNAIGSTKSGTGIAFSHAALRIAPLANDIPELAPYLADVPLMANQQADAGKISLEGTQGTFLSRYHGEYPNVTSVDVTAPSTVAGVGLNWRKVENVIVCVKALPTREGAGPMGDVEEFTVDEMRAHGILEFSSILDPQTGKPQIRRKAKGIDYSMLNRIIMLNGANQIALTFTEQVDPEIKDATRWAQVTPKIKDLVNEIERRTGVEVTLLNTGKEWSSMVSKTDDLPAVPPELSARLASYI
jgi:adenylosuccinate synthase